MSGHGYISVELPEMCQLCSKVAELRPYGPKGEYVCFECGMKDEESMKRGFSRMIMGEKEKEEK